MRIENINLAHASEEFYASRLHVLEIRSMVYVSSDVNVAKLHWQPNSELTSQSSRFPLFSRISRFARNKASLKVVGNPATNLFPIASFQIPVK